MSFEGNWQLTITSPMGERPAQLSVTETTGNLEGSLTTGMGTSPISGHADNGSVEFSATVQGPMGAMKLDFTGDVSGDEVSGEMQFGPMGTGPGAAHASKMRMGSSRPPWRLELRREQLPRPRAVRAEAAWGPAPPARQPWAGLRAWGCAPSPPWPR